MRRPVSAKKMALISSDLPRENSATKATTSFSLPRRSRSDAICSPAGALRQVVLGEKAGEVVDAFGQGAAPFAEGVETGRERMASSRRSREGRGAS